jgi:hypothetical protein
MWKPEHRQAPVPVPIVSVGLGSSSKSLISSPDSTVLDESGGPVSPGLPVLASICASNSQSLR